MGRYIALSVVAASLLAAAPAAAVADVGALTPVECFNDSESPLVCPIGNQGLNGASGVAVSPNGKSTYVASPDDRAIVRYDRSASGVLTNQGCISDVGGATCGGTQQGLQDVNDVAVSPDGRSVYAVAIGDRAIVRFDRDVDTGALTSQGCISDPGGATCGGTQQGLNGAFGVAVSPDGKSVYAVASTDSAITRFDRDTTTGALTPAGCIADVGDIAGCGSTQQGLNGARSVAVSPDGKSVYVAGTGDSAIVRFDRNTTTGALTGAGCVMDVGGSAGCGVTQQGLRGAISVAISPHGESVYVGASQDHAIAQFDRNTTTGALTGVGCVGDAGSVNCLPTQEGLNTLNSIEISADGRSVYAASIGDKAIVRFNRDAGTGALTGVGCITDVGSPSGCATTAQGLGGATGVAVGGDGNSVYVGSSGDDALVTFARVPDTSNHNRIALPGGVDEFGQAVTIGQADLYPSTIEVAGLDPKIADVNVTLEGLSHTFPTDVDYVLEGPNGQRVLLMSAAGGGAPGISDIDLTIDDSAATTVPNGPLTGTYLPTNNDTGFRPSAPAPYCNPGPNEAGAQAGCLAQAFRGTNPNGTWKLYAEDFSGGDFGALARGWSLDISTDVAPPETTIDSGPTGTIATTSTSFGFSSNEGGATFECSLDGAAFAPCTSPSSVSRLANGPHTFAVRATDPTGNVDASVATRSFNVDVDTSVPDTRLDGSASAARKQKLKGKKVQLAVVVDANEPLTVVASGSIALGKRKIALKGLTSTVAAGPSTLKLKPAKGKDAKKIAAALADGGKAKATITLELSDAAGNESSTKLGVKLSGKRAR